MVSAFVGAYERPGTYVVTAASAGFATKEVSSVRVVIGGGPCPHVEQARVAIALPRKARSPNASHSSTLSFASE
jgi:hypothetical protein